MILKASTPYKLPDDAKVQFLKVDLEALITDEMIELSETPYEDGNWVRLAYSVSTTAFRPYVDENFAGIIERKSADSKHAFSSNTTISTATPVNCLYFDTSHRSPGTCDWSREFKFFKGSHFLGGIGIYAIKLTFDSSVHDKLRSITRIAQYNLQSGNPFKRMLIAVIKQDSWEIAFVQSKIPISPPSSKPNNCRVDISLFRDPSPFIRAISSNLRINDIEHEKHTTRFVI
ncbi:hypothetical protein SAMN03159341_13239 [Paenibacillus sp. 1_12]|uniref:hypothetical protein n=1 Tax=Paenibacillus sp. 1_12 TaxID=1566278 RepID=UPI0008EEFD59|nr:hypothetical protein [Paenibacillus sp. 1_12]SFM42503.1 hypothetical protein SAMN03159341_13239 [Paenibacillus sp. 1_12]